MGMFSINSFVIVGAAIALFTSTPGVDAETTSVSVSVPTGIITSTVSVAANGTCNPVRFTVWNPGSSAVRS